MKIKIDNNWEIDYDDVSGIKTEHHHKIVYPQWKDMSFFKRIIGFKPKRIEDFIDQPEYWEIILLMKSGFLVEITNINYKNHMDMFNKVLREWKQNK